MLGYLLYLAITLFVNYSNEIGSTPLKIYTYVVLITVCFLSCTGYHEMRRSGSGGYGTLRLPNGNLEVSFGGNPFTPWYRAQRFALIRCAEVTMESRQNYFKIVNDFSHRTYQGSAGGVGGGSEVDVIYEIEVSTDSSGSGHYYNAKRVIKLKGRVPVTISRN